MEQKNLEKLIWEVSSKTKIPNIPDKKEAWEELNKKLDQSIDSPLLKKYSYVDNLRNLVPISQKSGYAYTLPLIIIFALSIYFKFDQTIIFKTNSGETLSVSLPDNSKIVLNSVSSVSYKSGFNDVHRILSLEGEAYFEVNNQSLPFIVQTKKGNITVLGTSFNVKARNDGLEVGVNSGLVKVSDSNSHILLNEKEHLVINEHSTFDEVKLIDHDKYPGWINQKLYCNNTSLEIICDEIERIHNVRIKFSNQKLKQVTVTGTIDTTELKTVLNTIAMLTQHSFKFEGGTYTII